MEGSRDFSQPTVGRQLIVKADEVDQVGTAIQSPTKQLPLSALDQRDGSAPAATRPVPAKVVRPVLRRDGSAPPPPMDPPPPAPAGQPLVDTPTNSLSLPQLKQLVSQFPKVDQRAYAFQYSDTDSFEVEIEDWFQYTPQESAMLLSSQQTFEERWAKDTTCHLKSGQSEIMWTDADPHLRLGLLKTALQDLASSEQFCRLEGLEIIFYILGGVWATTAGVLQHKAAKSHDAKVDGSKESHLNATQIDWMHKGADLVLESSGLPLLFDHLKGTLDEDER